MTSIRYNMILMGDKFVFIREYKDEVSGMIITAGGKGVITRVSSIGFGVDILPLGPHIVIKNSQLTPDNVAFEGTPEYDLWMI